MKIVTPSPVPARLRIKIERESNRIEDVRFSGAIGAENAGEIAERPDDVRSAANAVHVAVERCEIADFD